MVINKTSFLSRAGFSLLVFVSNLAADPGRTSTTTQLAAAFIARADLHIRNQEYQQALSEIESASSLTPEESKFLFLKCMLKERIGQPRHEATACYADVVEQLSQDRDTACASNMNCIVADLMADGADAERRKVFFLGLPASETESETRHFLLDDFERKEYLHTILP